MDKKHKEMSDLKTPVLTMQENMLFSGEIYTTGKQFTLPPVVTNLKTQVKHRLPTAPYFWQSGRERKMKSLNSLEISGGGVGDDFCC